MTRSEEFNTGTMGSTRTTSSLDQDSSAFNSQVPKVFLNSQLGPGTYSPNSILSQYMKDPRNGNGPLDAQRQTPSGQLPSVNDGFSKETYQAMNPSFGLGLKI